MSAYQALYRKYRPQTFDDVSGQMAVTQTLKTQIMTGKMSHDSGEGGQLPESRPR